MENTAVHYSLTHFTEEKVSIWGPKYGPKMGKEHWELALQSRKAADVLP